MVFWMKFSIPMASQVIHDHKLMDICVESMMEGSEKCSFIPAASGHKSVKLESIIANGILGLTKVKQLIMN